MQCALCNCELIQKNPKKYGKRGAECHISRHHYFPKRFKKYFQDCEIGKVFNIENGNQKVILCYQCHEEIVHNIVLSPSTIKKFNKVMKGKDVKKRILILYKQLLK